MPATILEKIVAAKQVEARRLATRESLERLRAKAAKSSPRRDFRGAITTGAVAVIAEVKRKSPSKGILSRNFDPVGLARLYEREGAAAVSVLTDRKFFGGAKEYLARARKAVSLPLLRKDFIIDPCQVWESRLLGADAVLLIAGLLGTEQLAGLLREADEAGLEALVEVHGEEDLTKALAAGAGLLGINNRDLHTFVTDISVSEHLAPRIPPGRMVVSESGIQTRADVERLTRAGIRTFLVGEALVSREDPGEKLRELLGK